MEELKITAPKKYIEVVPRLAKTCSSTGLKQFLYQQDLDQDGGGQAALFRSDFLLNKALERIISLFPFKAGTECFEEFYKHILNDRIYSKLKY